jgi:hypothetical protein
MWGLRRMTAMIAKTSHARIVYRTNEFDNIRELLEMLMSEHTPAKHKIKMKTSFGWEPPMNVFETDTEFIVIMDIAGMDQKDIGCSPTAPSCASAACARTSPPGTEKFTRWRSRWDRSSA